MSFTSLAVEKGAIESPALATERGGDGSKRGCLSALISRRWNNRWVVALAGAMAVTQLLIFIVEYSLEEGELGPVAEFWQRLEGGGRPMGLMEKADRQLPVFAFLITGSEGEVAALQRVLYAVYHPRNEYLLHLDRSAPEEEHAALAHFLRAERAFAEAGNVRVVTRPNAATDAGASATATCLHGLALLLRQRADWDWFVTLSAADYPLVTPDDLLHVFSSVPRHLNFVEHNVYQKQNLQIMAKITAFDSAISSGRKGLEYGNCSRPVPTNFDLYRGSAWVILTRAFSEYMIFGYDNLPRTLLLYHANSANAPEHYVPTLACNARDFNASVVNTDLRYNHNNNRLRAHANEQQGPSTLDTLNFSQLLERGDAFVRTSDGGSAMLDKIDKEVLHRGESRFVRGGWCTEPAAAGGDPCENVGAVSVLNVTDNARRLERHIANRLRPRFFRNAQCRHLLKLMRAKKAKASPSL